MLDKAGSPSSAGPGCFFIGIEVKAAACSNLGQEFNDLLTTAMTLFDIVYTWAFLKMT